MTSKLMTLNMTFFLKIVILDFVATKGTSVSQKHLVYTVFLLITGFFYKVLMLFYMRQPYLG